MLAGGLMSCDRDAEHTKNLPENLLGNWDIIQIGYSPDEETITEVSHFFSQQQLRIRDENPRRYIRNAPSDWVGPWTLNQFFHLFYSVSGNLMSFQGSSDESDPGTSIRWVPCVYIALDALTYANSFVIKGDELFIHFRKSEKNKNVLILKRH